jgi:hypothetical protein
MTSPLSGSLAAAVYKGMKALFLDATLVRDTITVPSPDTFDPAAPTQTTYTCKAIRDNYSNYDMQNNLIAVGDAKILILANSISTQPTNQDRVTIQGTTFSIVNVLVDPALAVWVCQGRL